jgi:ArsR family metal-binding transcriptional regulator
MPLTVDPCTADLFKLKVQANKHPPLTTYSKPLHQLYLLKATCYKVTEPKNFVTNINKMPGISG